jgi:hypothetical protein
MRAPAYARGALGIALLVAVWPGTVHGQITITGSDLFNKVGQHFEAYAEHDANVGGFLATLIMMYLTGLVIDLLHDPASGLDRYNIDSFRWGFAAQFLVIAVGITFFTIEKRKSALIDKV